MKKQTALNLTVIVLAVAAALLSAMPNAVKLNFAAPDETVVEYYSGYSMVPVGYAVWGAFGGAIGAIVLSVLGAAAAIFKDKGLVEAMLVIAVIAVILSLSTALLGCMTVVGGTVSAILAVEAALIFYIRRRGSADG